MPFMSSFIPKPTGNRVTTIPYSSALRKSLVPQTPGQRVDGWLCRNLGLGCRSSNSNLVPSRNTGLGIDKNTLLIAGAVILGVFVLK